MLDLETMPDHARVWIYQADRPFSDTEEKEIEKETQKFVEQWAAHGQQLNAGFTIKHHQFVILAVDESFNMASGCSIDASVGLVRKLQEQLGLNLLDRTKVAFYIDGKIILHSLNGIKPAIENGSITSQTEVFNNLVENTREWKENWLVPAEKTWLNRYFQ